MKINFLNFNEFSNYYFNIFSKEDIQAIYDFCHSIIETLNQNKNISIENILLLIFMNSKDFELLLSTIDNKKTEEIENFNLVFKILIFEILNNNLHFEDKIKKILINPNKYKKILTSLDLTSSLQLQEAVDIEDIVKIQNLQFRTSFFQKEEKTKSLKIINTIINFDFSFYFNYWKKVKKNKSKVINLFKEKKSIFISRDDINGSIFFQENLVYIVLKNFKSKNIELKYVSGGNLLRYFKTFSNMQKEFLLNQKNTTTILRLLSNINPSINIKPEESGDDLFFNISPEKISISPFIFGFSEGELIFNISGTQKMLSSATSSFDFFIDFMELEKVLERSEDLRNIEEILKKI